MAGLAGILAAGLWVPLSGTLATNREFISVDGREQSRRWIEANIPSGSAIALESYAPYLRPERYRLTYLMRAAEQPVEWYREQDIQYVVFSQGMFGRYLRDPKRYPARVAAYKALWDSMPEVMRFTDGGYEVRLHRVQ
jgi:hypothetical protein